MSTSEPAPFDEIFPGLSRDPSLRTYSHKRVNNTTRGSLPQLKPTPIHGPTRRTLTKVSPEPGGSDDGSVGDRPSEQTSEKDQDGHEPYAYEVEYADDTVDDEKDYGSEGANPAPARLHKPRNTAGPKILRDEYDLQDSEDELAQNSISQRTSITDYPSRPVPVSAPRLTTSTRRRPALTFNKPPAKHVGYKKLERKMSDVSKKTVASYIPGDGFSDSEARPNGLFHHTKKRKLHYSVPAVGSLDLTQAAGPSVPRITSTASATQPKEPRIIFKRKKRVRDNSFLPPTPKKIRQERDKERERRQERKNEMKKAIDGQHRDSQVTTASAISAPYGQLSSSVILGESIRNDPLATLPPIVQDDTAQVGNDGDVALGDREAQATIGSALSAPYGQLASSVILGVSVCNDLPSKLPPIVEYDTTEAGKDGSVVPGDEEVAETSLPILDHGNELAQIDDIQTDHTPKPKETIVPFSDFVVEATQYTRSQSVPLIDAIQEVEGSTPTQRTFRRVKTS